MYDAWVTQIYDEIVYTMLILEEVPMLVDRRYRAQAIASVLASTVAVGCLLALVAAGRVLPEQASLLTFLFALPLLVVSGGIGVVLGSLGLRTTEKRLHLIGLLIGEMTLVLVLLITLVIWFQAAR